LQALGPSASGRPTKVQISCAIGFSPFTKTDVNSQTGWKNADYDRLVAEANRTSDTAAHHARHQRCEQILADECRLAPLYFYTRNHLIQPEVRGWYGDLLDNHPLKGVYLESAAAR
jgi:oligopeptide transport system substrate-binding protein